jgi:hypothetical protein
MVMTHLPPDRRRAPARRSAWIAGLVVGVGAGFLSLSIPVVGWMIGLAFLAGAVLSRAVAAGIGGFLVGGGGTWLAVLIESDARCRAFNGPGRGCMSPDLAPWLAVGVALLLAGAVVTAIAARR